MAYLFIVDQCLAKYKFDQQKTMRYMILPNGSGQQFFMHVEMAIMREISINIDERAKKKVNSRLDASLSAT
jgi:hypothetical protein